MKFWTWAEIKAKIQAELDIQDEDFVREDELLGYANEAIDEAEAEIHTLYEDYFLTSVNIPVVTNNEFFSMSALMPNIYGDKIRRIIFVAGDGTTNYTVNRLRDWKKFEYKAQADTGTTTDLYQYMLVNDTPGVPQIMLVPKSRESGTLKVWYLRNANRLVNETSICDIPEFINFVFSHMKVKVYAKEGNPNYQDALERLETERQRMIAVLAARTPDAENEIEMDLSYYEDMW